MVISELKTGVDGNIYNLSVIGAWWTNGATYLDFSY